MTVKMVTGVVQRISIKPIANGPDRFDNNFRRSMQVDDVWFSFGGCKTDKWNVKMGNDFKVLGVGSEVAFKAEQSGDFWNGKSLMVLNLVEGDNTRAANGSTQGTTSYTPKPKASTEGVSTGHALNGAMNFLLTQGVDPSNENIVKYAQHVHNVTEKVKAAAAAKHTEMDAYNVGAMVGNSILNACKLIDPSGDFEAQVEALATDFLDNVVPKIAAHVKGEVKQAPPAKVTRASPAKKATTKATPVVEEPEDELDDQLPF